MDRRLTTLFKQGQADAILLCLNANVGLQTRGQINIPSCSPTGPKSSSSADPAPQAMLCRADAQIRDNILDSLAPQTELIAPDATRIPLEQPTSPQTSYSRFRAVASTVQAAGLRMEFPVNANRWPPVAIEARQGPRRRGHQMRAFEEELETRGLRVSAAGSAVVSVG